MNSLIYDLNLNKVIKCCDINTLFSINKNINSYEVSFTIIDNIGFSWVINWYQSMFSKGEYTTANLYKRDIHINKIDALLRGCFINSYNSDDNSIKVTITADYVNIGTDNQYLKYYRDLKIEELLD
jgi:hypothetical protein